MRIWPPRNGTSIVLVGVVVLAGVLDGVATTAVAASASSTSPAAPPPGAPNLVSRTVDVPGDLAQAPLDEPRQALVPDGLDDVGVGADPEGPAGGVDARRRAAGVGARTGQIVKLTPKPGAAPQRVDAARGTSTNRTGWHSPARRSTSPRATRSTPTTTSTARRPTAAPSPPGFPMRAAPNCNGAYAHALKSVAVGPDGAVYFSIGSTGNISAEDRDADPPRATIMRIPPGGGPAATVRDGRAQRHRAWPSRPTVRCGRRSTTATTRPDPDGNVDTRVRQRPSSARRWRD